MADGWRDVGGVTDFDADGRLSAHLEDTPLGVFKTPSGLFAVDDRCPHGAARLSRGYLDGATIECPLHNARFSLETGACVFGGAWTLARYDVRLRDHRIEVRRRRSDIP